ncbi:MAG: pentapeptide repeat-containing protein [Cyanobacteria bacterium J06638_28]
MSSFSGRDDCDRETSIPEADSPIVSASVPTLRRRLVAWALEVAILTGSCLGPLYLGGQLNQTAPASAVALSPSLQTAQQWMARGLGLPSRRLPQAVHPVTNLLWSASLGLPIVLAAAHLYSVGRYGKSWPKQWLGLQILALSGQMPGWRRTLLREGVGRWGGPLLVAYSIWHWSSAFPGLIVLSSLSLVSLITENLTGLGNRPHRPWHDWLAGTCIVGDDTGAIVRFEELWSDGGGHQDARETGTTLTWVEAEGGLKSVVLGPDDTVKRHRLRPSSVGIGLSFLLSLGGLAGVGGYRWLGQSHSERQADRSLYLHLVKTLTDPTVATADKRAATLALGNLADDRATELLVDLIAQTEDPQWLEALQQALMRRGAAAIPPLRQLNQSLSADLAMVGDSASRSALVIRLQTVNRALAKLIRLREQQGDRWQTLDFSHTHLGYQASQEREFTLALQNQDLSGIHWQSTILNRAQLQGTRFFSAGPDGLPDTFDDRMADLSGADLSHADLTGANLMLSRLVGSSLLGAVLNQADLTSADLTAANLEHAQLAQANLTHVNLVEARLSNADLTNAELGQANLTGARLSHVKAAGAQMSEANLSGVAAHSIDLTDADLNSVVLNKADLTGARLQRADLSNAVLRGTVLRGADLREARLQGADLNGADFAGTILTEPKRTGQDDFVTAPSGLPSGSHLLGVDFSDVRNLDNEQLTFVCAQGGIHPACDRSSQK